MTKNKQSKQQTLQLIVDILSFETPHSVLKHQLENSMIDWDAIVIVASKHLVLPAVYCRLQQKSLLGYLPEDLIRYLEELTHLNRERNQTLLSEAKQISILFTTHHIQHTFIKGIALLAGNYFKDFGERMIGDIDILVASEDLDKAFELLGSEGYTQFIRFNYEVENYRHQPRQLSEKHLGAIELHDQLFKHGYNHLIDKDLFLQNKEIVNEMAVPNSNHLIWNTILAQQINDASYYYNVLKLKGIYDVLVVGLPQKLDLISALSNQKYSIGFLSLTSIFCPKIAPSKETPMSLFKKNSFLLTLRFPKIGILLFKLKSIYSGVNERLELFLFNKSYRKHILKTKMIK